MAFLGTSCNPMCINKIQRFFWVQIALRYIKIALRYIKTALRYIKNGLFLHSGT